MRAAMIVMVLVALGGEAASAEAPPPAWQGYANAWIASHALRVKGKAPKDTRKTCEGDLNGDGRGDVVVIYSIEGVGGGTDWTQYATVLTSTPQGFGASTPKEVGGKSVRAVGGCSIAGTTIALDLKTYGPKDESCCPSVPGKATYRFEKSGLVDVPASASSASEVK